MKLNSIESEILIDIYDADMLPEMPFEIENYNLIEEDQKKKRQEFSFYLKKLKGLALIKYEEKEVFVNKTKYNNNNNNNNVKIIYDKIHIDSKGIKLVERYIYSNSEIKEKCMIWAK